MSIRYSIISILPYTCAYIYIACVSIRQHTHSIRQHMWAYVTQIHVSICEHVYVHTSVCVSIRNSIISIRSYTCAYIYSMRQHIHSMRQHMWAYVTPLLASFLILAHIYIACVSIRQHIHSIRQHMWAYVTPLLASFLGLGFDCWHAQQIRQHTSAYAYVSIRQLSWTRFWMLTCAADIHIRNIYI